MLLISSAISPSVGVGRRVRRAGPRRAALTTPGPLTPMLITQSGSPDAVEGPGHERVVVRRVGEDHELGAAEPVVVAGPLGRLLQDVPASAQDRVHVDPAAVVPTLTPTRRRAGSSRGPRAAVAIRRRSPLGPALLHQRGEAADEVDPDLARPPRRARAPTRGSPRPWAGGDGGDRADGDPAVDDRDAVPPLDLVADRRSRPANCSSRARTASAGRTGRRAAALEQVTPIVTVRTSSLCCRIIASVERSIRRSAPWSGPDLVRGPEDVVVLQREREPAGGSRRVEGRAQPVERLCTARVDVQQRHVLPVARARREVEDVQPWCCLQICVTSASSPTRSGPRTASTYSSSEGPYGSGSGCSVTSRMITSRSPSAPGSWRMCRAPRGARRATRSSGKRGEQDQREKPSQGRLAEVRDVAPETRDAPLTSATMPTRSRDITEMTVVSTGSFPDPFS